MTNIKLPKRKMKNITTTYPSMPQMRKRWGVGSGGGGLGHDATQSTHEQAGLKPCELNWQVITPFNCFHNLRRQIRCKALPVDSSVWNRQRCLLCWPSYSWFGMGQMDFLPHHPCNHTIAQVNILMRPMNRTSDQAPTDPKRETVHSCKN